MSKLDKFKLKDLSRDSCEHCGLAYWKELDMGELGKMRCKVHCDACIEAERTLDRISEVMNKTQLRISLLGDKEQDKKREFEHLITRQRAKMKIVLDNIRKYLKERQSKTSTKEQGSESRLPYKE